MQSAILHEEKALSQEIQSLKESLKVLEGEFKEAQDFLSAMNQQDLNDQLKSEDVDEKDSLAKSVHERDSIAQLLDERESLIKRINNKEKESQKVASLLADMGIDYFQTFLSKFKIDKPVTPVIPVTSVTPVVQTTSVDKKQLAEIESKNQELKNELAELNLMLEVFDIHTEPRNTSHLDGLSDKMAFLLSEQKGLEDEIKDAKAKLKEHGVGPPCESEVARPEESQTKQEEEIDYKALLRQKPKPAVLDQPLRFTLSNSIFSKNSDLRFDLKYYSGVPEPNKNLGNNEELNKVKALITPHAVKWERVIRNLMSKYELIDIYRGPSSKKLSIIRYCRKDEPREEFGLYPVFSRAYFKLWEILSEFKILDKYKNQPINISGLAEGPGGFIHCLIDWRSKQNGRDWAKDNYYGITLRVWGEDDGLDWSFPSDYFKYVRQKHSITLSYGKGGDKATGNLLEDGNLEYFRDVDLGGKKCELVTADGGIHLENDDAYSVQELANSRLFFVETLYALNIQAKGGSFVLKIYDIYYDLTVQLLQLLTFYYAKVTVTKPLTSRPASSEKYVVAEDFKGISKEDLENLEFIFFKQWFNEENKSTYLKNQAFLSEIFNFSHIGEELEKWQKIIREGNKKVINSQIQMIKEGLKIVEKPDISKEFILWKRLEQKEYSMAWCKRHDVPYNPNLRIV